MNPAYRFDEVDGVIAVLVDASANGENIGIKNDVRSRYANMLGEYPIAAFADFNLACLGISLAILSKAMTTIAAPYSTHLLAAATNASSPSLRLMELTMALPLHISVPLR